MGTDRGGGGVGCGLRRADYDAAADDGSACNFRWKKREDSRTGAASCDWCEVVVDKESEVNTCAIGLPFTTVGAMTESALLDLAWRNGLLRLRGFFCSFCCFSLVDLDLRGSAVAAGAGAGNGPTTTAGAPGSVGPCACRVRTWLGSWNETDPLFDARLFVGVQALVQLAWLAWAEQDVDVDVDADDADDVDWRGASNAGVCGGNDDAALRERLCRECFCWLGVV
ncbi:uncharacterized protein DNG_01734 [Cephalotrichum gorgonifer]|uniref:Uncharacterized protein n=1 Tax=Cephalotrichum gorgonifer TaxID=2041049 RepID=A0AAE8SSI5_9PEZI|nr:uncharacterized protein DNG_01734 [Cephalotrichum gorgonifer]